MPKPQWLIDKEEKQERTVLVTKCFGCDHCGEAYDRHKIRGEWKITRWCNLHNIEVGESSATCSDGTNIVLLGTPFPPPIKEVRN